MVTTDLLQAAFQAVVESHVTRPHFYSVWSEIKDTPADAMHILCFWRGTDTNMTTIDSLAMRDGFVIDCMFLDQSAVDRSSKTRDMHYSRMNAVARQCWAKFHQLYIANSTEFQGVELDFSPESTSVATFLRVWDIGPSMRTGCLLRVNIISGAPTRCEDIYFDAS